MLSFPGADSVDIEESGPRIDARTEAAPLIYRSQVRVIPYCLCRGKCIAMQEGTLKLYFSNGILTRQELLCLNGG